MNEKENKRRLIKNMEYVNPDFNVINEDQEVSPDVMDVERSANRATTLQHDKMKINTIHEFKDAFKYWFEETGIHRRRRPFNVSEAQSLVKEALSELGYS
jgi:hypothetical protein